MNKRQSLFLVLTFLASAYQQALSQEIIDVNFDIEHAVNGVSMFDRSKYMILHAGVGDGSWPSDEFQEEVLIGNDVYLGRNNGSLPWFLSQTKEDPNKPGWPSVSHLEQEGLRIKNDYINNTSIHKYENRITRYMMGGQEFMYPTNDNETGPTGSKWKMAKDGYKPLAEYYAQYFKNFFGNGGATGQPLPAYIEVMNEPFIKANKLGTTNANLTEMHKVVAKRIKELNPNAKIGGFSAAHPAYEANNFGHWENTWKLFIDNAGEEMDFFSLHLYDNIQKGEGQYRSGSNVEAILDMVEHYQVIKLGERKSFCLSEYGNLNTEGELYTKERDWDNLRSFNTMIMQFLERPDIIEQALPFMLLKATWWKPNTDNGQHPDAKYAHRLFRQKKELEGETGDEWVFTELIKFYQLWSKVKGTRVDTKSSNLDIQVDSYVDGNKAYVIINNMHHQARTVDLAVNGFGDANVTSVLIKHLNNENAGIPTLDEDLLTAAPSSVTIGREATIILEYTLDKALAFSETSEEKKYYATTYNKNISANQNIDFAINNVDVSSAFGEAILRIGMGRNHNLSLKPTLVVNGNQVEVPNNWRGNDQKGRDMFFGVLEVAVPYNILQANNTISLNYSDSGGRVSSMALQVQGFSTEITRSKEKFRLSQDNFRILTNGETCHNSNNGKIIIDAVRNLDYEVFLKETNSTKQFNTNVTFEDLAPGDYELCISVPSEDNYTQCFMVKIQEVEAISVTNKVNNTKNSVTYTLSGSNSYTIDFNGQQYITTDASIELSLKAGKNSIVIKGEKDCQGMFEENIFFNKIVSYPNPFTKEVTIDLGLRDSATLKIHNSLGVLVYNELFTSSNHKIDLDTSFLKEGIYFFTIETTDSMKRIKSIKISK